MKNNAITTAKIKNGAVTGPKLRLSTLGKVPMATNADQLGGSPPTAYRDGCPSGTTRVAADLCSTSSDAQFGEATWVIAVADCASIGMRLPSPAEALLLISVTTEDESYWTDSFWLREVGEALRFKHEKEEFPNGGLFAILATTPLGVRCVTAPSNA